jgi:hypothetical protein
LCFGMKRMLPEDRVSLSRAEDEGGRKAIADIREHGVHILHVFDPEGNDPEFSYTVGLWHTHQHPEVLIAGLKEDLRHTLLNNLNFKIGQGKLFTDGLSSTDVLEGHNCYFQEIPEEHFREYFGWNRWFYGGNDFSAVQMLWPNIYGVYPWDEKASEALRQMQPVLTKVPFRGS